MTEDYTLKTVGSFPKLDDMIFKQILIKSDYPDISTLEDLLTSKHTSFFELSIDNTREFTRHTESFELLVDTMYTLISSTPIVITFKTPHVENWCRGYVLYLLDDKIVANVIMDQPISEDYEDGRLDVELLIFKLTDLDDFIDTLTIDIDDTKYSPWGDNLKSAYSEYHTFILLIDRFLAHIEN